MAPGSHQTSANSGLQFMPMHASCSGPRWLLRPRKFLEHQDPVGSLQTQGPRVPLTYIGCSGPGDSRCLPQLQAPSRLSGNEATGSPKVGQLPWSQGRPLVPANIDS